jgi:hypothetical protein
VGIIARVTGLEASPSLGRGFYITTAFYDLDGPALAAVLNERRARALTWMEPRIRPGARLAPPFAARRPDTSLPVATGLVFAVCLSVLGGVVLAHRLIFDTTGYDVMKYCFAVGVSAGGMLMLGLRQRPSIAAWALGIALYGIAVTGLARLQPLGVIMKFDALSIVLLVPLTMVVGMWRFGPKR